MFSLLVYQCVNCIRTLLQPHPGGRENEENSASNDGNYEITLNWIKHGEYFFGFASRYVEDDIDVFPKVSIAAILYGYRQLNNFSSWRNFRHLH